ncbi:hypothetical protein [Providencia hangzhouensis]
MPPAKGTVGLLTIGSPISRLYRQLNTQGGLEQRLRENMESPLPKLNWGWMIEGGFNDAYQLCFALRLCGHRRGYYRYWRPSINHDFAVIEKILITEFGFISPNQ